MSAGVVMHVCPVRGCGELTSNDGDCGAHPERKRASDARRHAKQRAHGRDTAAWRRLRLARLELTRGRCELRADKGCTVRATTVHLAPELGGRHELATIVDVRAACAHCHGVVDAPRASRRLTGGGSVTAARVARPARRLPRETSTTR